MVVGAANASNAAACLISPPMYQRAASDSSAYPLGSKNRFVPSFQRLMCTCIPDPLSPNIGLGMNVAVYPFW